MDVVVNGERYLEEKKLVKALAVLYYQDNKNKPVISILCDTYLDPTGRLLGLVRDEAIRIRPPARSHSIN